MLQRTQKRTIALEAALAVLLVLLLHGIYICLSGKGFDAANDYNSYTRQCLAWLEGRLDLGQNYTWLELAVYQDKYYVSFPPFPSYILLPFTALFGLKTPDMAIALVAVAIGVVYAARITAKFTDSALYIMLLPVFFYCGTAVWQITVDGAVWFIAQNFSMALTLMSLYYALAGHKGRSLFFLVCAAGCRPFQVLYLPLVLFLLYQSCSAPTRKERLRALFFGKLWTILPAFLLGVSYLVLNGLRFGNPLEFGHNYLPEFVRSPSGQFSLSYLQKNFSTLFRLPSFDTETGALTFPLFDGMNIFLSFPVLIWYLFLLAVAIRKLCKRILTVRSTEILVNAIGLAFILLHIFLLLMHRTMGGHHFGHRYIADTLPCLFLCICFLSREPATQGNTPAAALRQSLFSALFLSGMMINFYGVLTTYTWNG